MRCRHCDDVIGVYEPLVILADGQPRETSRALEPNGSNHATDSVCYHRACFERLASTERSRSEAAPTLDV